jgi:hypothetical protein
MGLFDELVETVKTSPAADLVRDVQSHNGLLGYIYSKSDSLKRNLKDSFSDPIGRIRQTLGRISDDPDAFARELAAGFNPSHVGMAGATVWHGSPHLFERFDSSKIGTGEGAQAYGHGLYTAESMPIAKSYAEGLSTPVGPTGDVAKYWRANGGEPAFRQFAKDAGLKAQEVDDVSRAINSSGNLYKVDLPDAAISQMLNWDAPLHQQAPYVQDIARDVISQEGLPSYLSRAMNKTPAMRPSGKPYVGRDLYDELALYRGDGVLDQPQASDLLDSYGIPGIRYLDQGSRGAGAGTSNFVTFPGRTGLLNILERNGQPIK